MFVHAVWKLIVPPRVHIFLWLMSKGKLLTRDNLVKRKHLNDKSCLLCSEEESIYHLFFDCCIAKRMWSVVNNLLNWYVGEDLESVARWWISNKRYKVQNTICAAVLWSLWKTRNALCFQGKNWMCVKQVLCRATQMLRN